MTNCNENLTREVGVLSILLDKQAEKTDIYTQSGVLIFGERGLLYPSTAQL